MARNKPVPLHVVHEGLVTLNDQVRGLRVFRNETIEALIEEAILLGGRRCPLRAWNGA